MEHDAQPRQGDQHQLIAKESGNHGTIPSRRWSNEGIVPGFQTAGISRRLEVQDQRLNATFREHLAPLARRCRALARHTVTLHEGMFLVGTVYNFCTPHESLSHTQQTTPAMAAGITDLCWTMYELLSLHVPLSRWAPPKRRGRPSRALQHLIERWCS